MTRLTALSLAMLALSGAASHADTEICQTVNGRTHCVHATGNVSCTTVNGETRCTKINPEQPEPLPDIAIPGVDMRRDGDRLHVQAGGTEIVIEQETRP